MRIYTVSPRAEAPSRRTEASQQYRKTLAVRRMKEASQSARPLSNTHAIAAQSSFFKAIDQAGPTFSSERRLVQATPQQKWSKNADKNVTKLFPEISKSATSTTSLTSSSVPQEFEFLLEQKRPKSAAHQSYKSDRSGDQLSEPFHFDIEIVKNAANQSLLSFEGWEEDSNDSSSTLSTRSLRVGDEITGEFQKISFQKSQISRNNEDSGVLNDRRMRSAHNGIVANLRQRGRQIDSNGWNTPTFPEISQNEMKPNPETRNPTWTMFSSNTFQPIEKPAFPPKSATVVAVPKAKLANSHKSRRLASPTQLQVTKQRAPPLDQQNDLPLDSRPHLDDIKSIDTLSFATTPKQAHPHRRFQNESMETQPSDVRPDRALFHRKWSLVKPSLTVNRKAHREPHTTDLDGGSVSLQGSHDGTGKGRQISAMKTESKLASTTKSARYEHPLTDATTFLYQQPSRSQSPHKLEKVFERSIPELTHTAHKKQDTLLAEPTCAGPAALKPAIPSNASVLAKMLKKRSKLNCPSQPSQLDVPMTSIKSVNSPATCAKEVRKPTAESHVVTDHIEMSDELFIISVNSNPDLSKYARMIKVGLPLPIIKNAMQRDGVAPASQTESRNVLAKEPTNLIADEPIQRFRIHWESHSNVRSNTMWAMIGREDHWFVDISVDNEEMVSLFQKDRRPVSKQPPSENPSNGDSENGAKVVDSKRANNCGIILARIRLSYREIAIAIDSIDETALTFEQINGIMTFIPTEEESKGLKAIEDNARISGQPPFKVECEKFMAEIMYVDNAKQKIAAMSFMKRLPNCVEELKNGTFCEKSHCF